MSYTKIDNQLYELQEACRRHPDRLADWVLFTVSRYISTDRASSDFINAFCAVSPACFPRIISKCIAGDRSDDAILAKFKRSI